MGYTTDFLGDFVLDKDLDEETKNLIKGLSSTRRILYDINKLSKYLKLTVQEVKNKYGEYAEFYFPEYVSFPCPDYIIDFNKPPPNQPGLWCQWTYKEGKIVWDGNEKFYFYIDWLVYIIKVILKPRGYILNGEVFWQGQYNKDKGEIKVINNNIYIYTDMLKDAYSGREIIKIFNT